MNGLITCNENCKYQCNGECELENVPKYCLQLNSKKACIYYKPKENKEQGKRPKQTFEVYY